MKEKTIKIKPKLLKPIMEILDKVEDEHRMICFNIILHDIERTMKIVHEYANEHNIDYDSALKIVLKDMDAFPIHKYLKMKAK